MQSAPTPQHERERVRAVRALGLLEASAERFDPIVHVASGLLDVPIAMVTVIDADRQRFPACVGLDVDQVMRGVSICAHAIGDREALVIPDLSADDRFVDNPFVAGEPSFCAYAGIPYRDPEGHLVGTLCVLDTVPRQFDDEDVAMLRRLVRWVELEVAQHAAQLQPAGRG